MAIIPGTTVDVPMPPSASPARAAIAQIVEASGDPVGYLTGIATQYAEDATQAVANSVLPLVGEVAGAAFAVNPIAGAVVAAGSAIASVFGGLFGGAPPPNPKPNIGGINLDFLTANPLADANLALFAGKITAGLIDGVDPAPIRANAAVQLRNQLRPFVRAHATPTVAETEALRPVAYFLGTCDYDALYGGGNPLLGDLVSDAFTLKLVGTLQQWATLRLRLREILVSWSLWKQAVGGLSYSDGNANEPYGDRFAWLDPSLGYASGLATWPRALWQRDPRAPCSLDGRHWRSLAGGTMHEATAGQLVKGAVSWLTVLMQNALPAPALSPPPEYAYSLYAPIDPKIVASEMAGYYRGAHVVLWEYAVSGRPVYVLPSQILPTDESEDIVNTSWWPSYLELPSHERDEYVCRPVAMGSWMDELKLAMGTVLSGAPVSAFSTSDPTFQGGLALQAWREDVGAQIDAITEAQRLGGSTGAAAIQEFAVSGVLGTMLADSDLRILESTQHKLARKAALVAGRKWKRLLTGTAIVGATAAAGYGVYRWRKAHA